MNADLFRYHAAKNHDNQKSIAAFLGKCCTSISYKLSGKRGDFSRGDIAKLKARWKLTPQDIDAISFSEDTVK